MSEAEIANLGQSSEPVSPISQYFNSSALSVSVLAVLEFEVPLDDLESRIVPLLSEVFLPISPRFSSIMTTGKNGTRKWKRVNVNLQDHFHVVEMSRSSSPAENTDFLRDYLTQLGLVPFPSHRPLWQIHAIRYPTTEASATLIFKLHHSLGDGYSLMGALLSCLQRADDPSQPLTFPSVRAGVDSKVRWLKVFPMVFNTIREFGSSLFKSTCLVDDPSPVRSIEDGIEFRPFVTETTSFSLDSVKQVKSRLNVTINDIICGTIFLGTRLYMQKHNNQNRSDGCDRSRTTSLVLLNTRVLREYKMVDEMARPATKSPWGNRFSFLHVSVPKLTADSDSDNPLKFVRLAHEEIKRKRSSLAVYLTGQVLELIKKISGPEAAANYMWSTLRNSSMGMTNMIGPTEKMSLRQHPVKGLYFIVLGSPQSLSISIVSYAGQVRIAVVAEKDFIDSRMLALCINDAFTMISRATSSSSNGKKQ